MPIVFLAGESDGIVCCRLAVSWRSKRAAVTSHMASCSSGAEVVSLPGTLGLIDRQARELDARHVDLLRGLADLVEAEVAGSVGRHQSVGRPPTA